jgi:hypothetical protein
MSEHPNMVPYACDDPNLGLDEIADIDEHLHSCAECRDFVLFIRKMNESLGHDIGVKRWEESQRIASILEDNAGDTVKTAKVLGLNHDQLLARLETPALRFLMRSKSKTKREL